MTMRALLPTVTAVAALLAPATGVLAQAAALPDPTRPPPGFVGEVPTGGGGATDATVSPGARAAAAEEPAQGGLQSVLIPRSGKPVAIIGGKYVPLGERYGDYELVAVGETEVVLARGRERKALKLTPGAEKKIARATPGDDRKAAAKARPATAGGKPAPRKESETGR